METVIYIFGSVIIFAIAFIAYHIKFVMDNRAFEMWPFQPTSLIVERIYKPIEIRHEVIYTMMSDYEKMRFNMMPSGEVIQNNDHYLAVVRDVTYRMMDEVVKSGAIEIKETNYRGNPYERIMSFRLQVYKEQL